MIPDRALSLRFLHWLYPTGPWMLTCISTDKLKIESRAFGPDDQDGLLKWMDLHSKRNLYFSVNEPVYEAREKTKLLKSDVDRVWFLHVDVDPREGEPLEAEQARIRAQLESYHVRPSCLIFSGGGYNALWRLTSPMPVARGASGVEEAVTRAVDIERRNWQFELDFSTPDHCRDVCRILRLPGTVNWPTEKKLRAGRVPALASLAWHEDLSYDYDGFMATPLVSTNSGTRAGGPTVPGRVIGDAVRTESLDALRITPRLRIVIERAEDPEDLTRWSGDRSQALYFACCEMVRQGLSDETILGIITDSRFAISASVLDKGARTQRYALRQIQRARDGADSPRLAEMNDEYAIVLSCGSQTVVMVERGRYNERTQELEPVFQSFRDFKNRIKSDQPVPLLDGKKTQSAFEWWTSHPRRRTYVDIAFEPGEETPGRYNLWTGFTVQPRPGVGHHPFLEHVYENVCSGVQDHYDYLINWVARLIQRPRTQSEVAPVLLGERGIGKSTFTETIGHLLGKHAFFASDVDDMTGKFNAHLQHCVLLVAEEAFDLRNKRHESVLKHLITGKAHAIERKNVDKIQLPNYVHLIMTSNLDRVVPAGDHERRYFVIRVSSAKMQDTEYFGRIHKELAAGGYESLLHHLMSVDISEFNVRKFPVTQELRKQQEYNLSLELEWLLERLHAGQWWDGHADWRRVRKKDLHARYLQHLENSGQRSRPRGERAFHALITEEIPGTTDMQIRDGHAGDRPMVFLLPPLEDCRRAFARRRGWGEDYVWTSVMDLREDDGGQVIQMPGAFE